MQEYLKTCISDLQSEVDFKLRAIETMPDHIHILVSIPPHISVSKVVQRLKGVSSRDLRQKFPELTKRLPTLWTRSKFVASTGGVTLDAIKQYVETQKGVLNAKFSYRTQILKIAYQPIFSEVNAESAHLWNKCSMLMDFYQYQRGYPTCTQRLLFW